MLSLLKSNVLRTACGLVAIVTGSWLGAACTSTETVGGQNPLETESGFCQELATRQCSAPLVASCYNANANNMTEIKNDTSRCVSEASRAEVCNPSALPYHPEAAQDALDQIETIYEDGKLSSDELPKLADALAQVFNHGGAQSSHCNVTTDCDVTNGLSCITHNGKGFCGTPVMTGGGESCAKVNAACEGGFFCDSGLHCVSQGKQGEKCDANAPCVAGSQCVGGKCSALAHDGSSCGIGTDCQNGFCLKDDAQDKTGMCAGQDTFNPFSTSCDPFK